MSDVLDPSLLQQSNNRGFSHWLRDNSFSQLQMYGDAYFIITDKTKAQYVASGENYGDINKEALIKLDNTTNIDFSDYDNWTFGTNFSHVNQPDGVVDWIIMIHREDYGDNNFHPGHGIAALGFGDTPFTVENGTITIKRTYPGSGTSMEDGVWRGLDTGAYGHELGHLLHGSGHGFYHKDPGYVYNRAYWGLLVGRSDLINAWDRERLGWIDYNDITTGEQTVVISDYATTGDAYRIQLPGVSGEYIILENHQEISDFDVPSLNGSAKGLYILHVKEQGTSHNAGHDIESAEGSREWTNPYWIANPWGPDSIPVFAKGVPERDGFDAFDGLPTTKAGNLAYFKNWAEVIDGQTVINRRVVGSTLDPYTVGYNQVFSPWSNPNSKTWNGIATNITVEVLSEVAGVYTAKVYTNGNGHLAAPSNPLLVSLSNFELGGQEGIKVTWLANLEPDIDGYEVYRRINGGSITKVSGSNLVTGTSWVNWGVVISNNNTTDYTYYVKVKDTQGKYSNLSNGITTDIEHVSQGGSKNGLVSSDSHEELQFALLGNYPNPFNPSTHIQFSIPENGRVVLNLYNIQGQLVKTLVNGIYSAGVHSVEWDGRTQTGQKAASGIYFYTLQTENKYQAKKMILVE